MDFVVVFDRRQAFREESYGVPFVIRFRQLFEDSSGRDTGAVHHDAERVIVCRKSEYRRSRNGFLHFHKGFFFIDTPNKGFIFLCEVEEGAGNVGEMFDKPTIEVCEAVRGLTRRTLQTLRLRYPPPPLPPYILLHLITVLLSFHLFILILTLRSDPPSDPPGSLRRTLSHSYIHPPVYIQ